MSSKRIDQVLVELGFFESRTKAQNAILEGLVLYKKKKFLKPNQTIVVSQTKREDFQILNGKSNRYVSRGGLKLEGVLDKIRFNANNLNVLDVGVSTGGFTDCLLKRGAKNIVGVDVGHGQVHKTLEKNPRVTIYENTDIRVFEPKELFDLIVADVSFISLHLIIQKLNDLLMSEGHVLALVKPQFELEPSKIGRGGIVKPQYYAEVEKKIKKSFLDTGFNVLDYFECEIKGTDGNQEFFIYAQKN